MEKDKNEDSSADEQKTEPMQDLDEQYSEEYQTKDESQEENESTEDEDEFEKEFYEPALTSTTANIIGWTIAIILFILSIWLLWIALK